MDYVYEVVSVVLRYITSWTLLGQYKTDWDSVEDPCAEFIKTQSIIQGAWQAMIQQSNGTIQGVDRKKLGK